MRWAARKIGRFLRARRELEARVQALEDVIAGAGAAMASPPDPRPCATAEQRVGDLEAIVTGAGSALRSIRP